MKLATLLTLLATSTAALAGSRTVVFTNEQSGRGTSAVIPTTGKDVSVKAAYPAVYAPSFQVDSVMITSGVVEGAYCKVHGTTKKGKRVILVEVDGRKNYAKFPKDKEFVPESLKINCV
ncbi:hypothetical protein BJY04DRAFT_176732 [Aspergillus karnatakaensis]|uniref:uncharacterized protein n=1 Tax=Aspergillus karnatakaensis TaxID=1810916 RepID=UPI003CCCD2D7